MSQAPILTLTLNPALDMATEVHEMIPGHKLRCSEPQLDPGGGGLNVSRAIKALGGDSLALVAIGGLTGDRLAGLIRGEGVTFLSILGPGETRQSLTVNEASTGKQYRFMLPGPVWGEAERARVFTLLRATARPGGISVISGSQPPGVPVDFPAQLAASMPETRVVLDTSGSTLTEAVRHPIPGLRSCGWTARKAKSLPVKPLPTLADTAEFAQSLVHAGRGPDRHRRARRRRQCAGRQGPEAISPKPPRSASNPPSAPGTASSRPSCLPCRAVRRTPRRWPWAPPPPQPP
jgi:6-phosphofructokinase 2